MWEHNIFNVTPSILNPAHTIFILSAENINLSGQIKIIGHTIIIFGKKTKNYLYKIIICSYNSFKLSAHDINLCAQ